MTGGKLEKEKLYECLKAYGASDYYGFHMPGHKRQMGNFCNPYEIDITEIEGFDDLHHPKENGILGQAQERAARLYGAKETHFLVNGSTAGILSAVSGCVPRRGRLLMARNCHRSVYHAAALRDLTPVYVYPKQVEFLGINGGILPADVENALTLDHGIQAVIVTSPTYDGVCSHIREIAGICHRFGKPLLVDQAHGAHFPFSEYFPEDAIKAGADVVIHSVHKTLPALTQTALLHIQGNLVDRERIRSYLSIYQTSSPSYVLMASIDSCMELLEREGKELFEAHVQQLAAFRESCRDLEKLTLEGETLPGRWAIADFDRAKLLFSTRKWGIAGSRAAELLLERYHLQMEMATPYYLVGIASAADTPEGFARLKQAVHELDREAKADEGRSVPCDSSASAAFSMIRTQAELSPGTALEQDHVWMDRRSCKGRLAAAYVYLYPPGIPLLVPGERIEERMLDQIAYYEAAGLAVYGLAENGQMAVLKN